MLNILFISQLCPEYGQSLIYDGLQRLGHAVVDYPYNWTFHFDGKYECKFDCKSGPCNNRNCLTGCDKHPSHLTYEPHLNSAQSHLPLTPINEIWNMKWDLIVTNSGFGYEELYRKLAHVPVAVLDLGDSLNSYYDVWTKCLGKEPEGYFRREYLPGQKGHSLQYAAYDDMCIFRPYNELEWDVACCFRPTNPLRKEITDALVKSGLKVYAGTPSYPEYLDILSKSKFGLSLPGAGYVTLRDYEIPARGSVLAIPSFEPISRTYTFKYCDDGYKCIEFSCIDELIGKIRAYTINYGKNDYLQMRQNSYSHLKAHHTTSMRALELLHHMGF